MIWFFFAFVAAYDASEWIIVVFRFLGQKRHACGKILHHFQHINYNGIVFFGNCEYAASCANAKMVLGVFVLRLKL